MIAQYKERFASSPLFLDEDPDEIIAELGESSVKEFKSGDYICREGEYDENCCIILSGQVSVVLPQKDGSREKRFTLNAGEVFGEIAALSGNPRTADIVASGSAMILNIPRPAMFKLLDKFSSIKRKIDALYRQRALSTHLLVIPVFAGVPDTFIEELVSKVTLSTYRKGAVVFNQGDEADAFYLVRYGFVKVCQNDGGREKILAYLKEGHYFGEMALLGKGEKRMASVSAINRAELIKISRDDFEKLIESHPNVKRNLEKAIRKRKERNIQLQNDSHLADTLRSTIETGLIQAKSTFIIDLTKCVQCDTCVNACAALHDGKARLIRKGARFNNFTLIPVSCRSCEDPTCMSDCPTGAITRDFHGEIYHKDFCIGCGSCAKNCPYGNISIITVESGGEKPSLMETLKNIFFIGGSKNNKNGSNGAEQPGATAKFVFPGDRDMAPRAAADRFPGDRDMMPRGVEAGNGSSGEKLIVTTRKAVKCDMCREYDYLGCVYNCPTGAARRVDPTKFFADISTVG